MPLEMATFGAARIRLLIMLRTGAGASADLVGLDSLMAGDCIYASYFKATVEASPRLYAFRK